MDVNFVELLSNYGAMGVMLVWFMIKNNRDMETFKQTIQQENTLTREALNELKIVIANIGGQKGE